MKVATAWTTVHLIISATSHSLVMFCDSLSVKTHACHSKSKHLTTVMLCLCASGLDCNFLPVVLCCVHYPCDVALILIHFPTYKYWLTFETRLCQEAVCLQKLFWVCHPFVGILDILQVHKYRCMLMLRKVH